MASTSCPSGRNQVGPARPGFPQAWNHPAPPQMDSYLRMGPMRVVKKQLRVLLVFGREDSVCEAWRAACVKRGHEVTIKRTVELALKCFQEQYHPLVVVDARSTRHFDATSVCNGIRQTEGGQTSVLLAVVKRSFADRDNATVGPMLKMGFNRVLVESSAVGWVLNEVAQLEHGELAGQSQIKALQAVFSALDACKELIHITDNQHRILYVNRPCEQLLGYNLEDLAGRNIWELHTTWDNHHRQQQQQQQQQQQDPNKAPPPQGEQHQKSSIDFRTSSADHHKSHIEYWQGEPKVLLDISEAVNLQMRRGREWEGVLSCRRRSGELLHLPSRVVPGSARRSSTQYLVYLSDSHHHPLPTEKLSQSLERPIDLTAATDHFHPRGSIKSLRKGSHSHDIRSINSDGTQNLMRRQSLVKLHSLTIEAPITRVFNIISAAQDSSPSYVAQALEKALEILRSTELYSPQLVSSATSDSTKPVPADPVATDLLGGLLAQPSPSIQLCPFSYPNFSQHDANTPGRSTLTPRPSFTRRSSLRHKSSLIRKPSQNRKPYQAPTSTSPTTFPDPTLNATTAVTSSTHTSTTAPPPSTYTSVTTPPPSTITSTTAAPPSTHTSVTTPPPSTITSTTAVPSSTPSPTTTSAPTLNLAISPTTLSPSPSTTPVLKLDSAVPPSISTPSTTPVLKLDSAVSPLTPSPSTTPVLKLDSAIPPSIPSPSTTPVLKLDSAVSPLTPSPSTTPVLKLDSAIPPSTPSPTTTPACLPTSPIPPLPLTQQAPKPLLSARRSSNDTGSKQGSQSGVSRSSLPALQQHASAAIRELLAEHLSWNFDIFKLEKISDKRPLVWLGMSLLCRFDAPDTLCCDEQTLQNWLTLIEANYHAENSYHNSTHAADVLHATAYFLDRERMRQLMDPLDVVACLIAAVVHDVDHPGKNSAFLCNTDNELALLYNDQSVLESHHAAITFKHTHSDPRVNIFKGLERDTYKHLRSNIVDMVLATDMTKHFEHLSKFLNMAATSRTPLREELDPPDTNIRDSPEPLDFASAENLVVIKRMLIKCADVSNPLRPVHLSKDWAYRIANEYFNQTEEEKRRGLPIVMPQFDRTTCSIPKSQIGFMDFFINDMFDAWDALADIPELMEQLRRNYQYWKEQEDGGTLPPTHQEEEREEEEEEEEKEKEKKEKQEQEEEKGEGDGEETGTS
ncbi:hypothetical protein Pmani_027186 [Petrolisthes manimaculis]|uniref:3',5'-cyclic-AMP phosphodiesterase n=1 Tax=Petrolisthes manimaculis TaxID=1843537 RepID=A0AAE1TX40_9EUCA|nr:hypothetical protein Pmani_027186 [Petrolisthes manimaculis]